MSNLDQKIEAKIKDIDEKMKDGVGLNLQKLQMCFSNMNHMGPIMPSRGCDKFDDESLEQGTKTINKLMLLQALNIYESAIANELIQ